MEQIIKIQCDKNGMRKVPQKQRWKETGSYLEQKRLQNKNKALKNV